MHSSLARLSQPASVSDDATGEEVVTVAELLQIRRLFWRELFEEWVHIRPAAQDRIGGAGHELPDLRHELNDLLPVGDYSLEQSVCVGHAKSVRAAGKLGVQVVPFGVCKNPPT